MRKTSFYFTMRSLRAKEPTFNCPAFVATAGNAFYGLAIGFTVAAGAFAGGTFNSAVATGCLIMGLIPGSNFLTYIAAQLAAGALAAFVFRFLNPEDK